MRYRGNGKEIRVGDRVIVEGNVHGIVVCDFDRWESVNGHAGWLTKEELVGGGSLKSGVMVQTTELGMLHYPEEDDALVPDPQSRP